MTKEKRIERDRLEKIRLETKKEEAKKFSIFLFEDDMRLEKLKAYVDGTPTLEYTFWLEQMYSDTVDERTRAEERQWKAQKELEELESVLIPRQEKLEQDIRKHGKILERMEEYNAGTI